MKTMKLSVITILLIIITSGCQKFPQAEIDEARAIIDSAKIENIHESNPEEFMHLEDSINIVLEEIENQRSKFSIKKYDPWKEQLINLTEEMKELIRNTPPDQVLTKQTEIISDKDSWL